MLTSFLGYLREFVHEEDGQGISEYAAVIAYVSALVALVFMMGRGGLISAISTGHSNCIEQVQQLNAEAYAAD